MPVSGTIGNYQLTDQQQVDRTYSRYTYTAQLTLTGAAVPSVIATASDTDPNSQLIFDTLSFGDVPANGVVVSQSTFTIQRPTTQTFDPSTLTWKISSIAAPTTVTLLDSGTYDNATGDGIFTGTLERALARNFDGQQRCLSTEDFSPGGDDFGGPVSRCTDTVEVQGVSENDERLIRRSRTSAEAER